MTSFALLFTLAAIGISEATYLVRKRIASQQPVCPIGEGCEMVLTSKYNKIFLIHNDTLGLIAYIVMAFITALLVIGVGPTLLLNNLFKLIILGATVASLIFTYLQWKVIKAWCFWCLMSACTIGLMALIIILTTAI